MTAIAGGTATIDAGDGPVRGRLVAGGAALRAGDRAVLAVRPEMVRLTAPGAGGTGGRVLNRIFLGEHTEYLVRTDGLGDLLALVPRGAETGAPFAPGDEVALAWPELAALALLTDRRAE